MMTLQQKRAWFNLIVLWGTICLVAVLYPVTGGVSLAFLGLWGLSGFERPFFRAKKGEVVWDEREAQIQLRANTVGFVGLWIYLTLACMVTWIVLRLQARRMVTIDVLPWVFMGAALILMTVRSIAILVQYRGERGDGKN